jgi:hypothetical protein
MNTPNNERRKVMIPIMIADPIIDSSIKDRLNPTARASMLVATDKINKTLKLEELTNCFASLDSDSHIILNPMKKEARRLSNDQNLK